MGELTVTQGLTEKQQGVVDGLLNGLDVRDAMTLAGYSEDTNPSHVMGSRAIQKALSDRCDAKLRGELRAIALQTLEDLLSPSTPAATRFQAAKFIAEQSKPGDSDDKPLSEMTEDELMKVIDAAQQRVRAAQEPRIIDVTPQSGA